MGACREGASIWFWLWRGRKFKSRSWRRIFQSPYFWQDSFLTPFNRLIGCKLFGHRNVRDISDPGQPKEWHCFSCYRTIKKEV